MVFYKLAYILFLVFGGYMNFRVARNYWRKADVEEKVNIRHDRENIFTKFKKEFKDDTFERARNVKDKLNKMIDSDY